MKHRIIIYLSFVISFVNAMGQLSFTGNEYSPVAIAPEASTGLNQVYVLYTTEGVRAHYKANSSNIKWQKYSNLGGGYAQDLTPVDEGNSSYSISLESDDMGYIIEDGDKRFYCWITNYSKHMARFDALNFAEEQDCDRTRLSLAGNAAKIMYYTITGAPRELSRNLELKYYTLVYDNATDSYSSKLAKMDIAAIDGTFGVEAPLCDTEFTLSGDRFLKAWHKEITITSQLYVAIAVEAHTSALQDIREYDNEQSAETSGLGGSGPVDIDFTAIVTDAAIFREWQMSRDPEFEIIDNRYSDLDFTYSFRDSGTTYVRFVCNNAQGSCEYVSETYEVFVGESALICPNAFSPGASEGINDEWKVSYKSIVKFECHIFNRWGQKMFSFYDPGQGWDGKYNGKLVPAGAYFYVIKAQGSDGRKYDLSGDINIVRAKISQNASAETE